MSDSRWERWGPVAGIIFVVLFFVGVNLGVANLPSGDDSLQKISNFYLDKGNRAEVIIGSYLLWLAGLFFIWFLASVRTRLLDVEGVPGRLTSIAFGGGLVFVAMLFVAAACFASVAGDITFGGEKFVSPDAARFIPEIGYPILLIGGMFAAIAMIDAVSILILRTGMLPRWIGWFGFFAAVVLLAAVFFIPIVAFLLWVLFVSVAMLRGPREATVPPSPVIPPA
jgi:hypothetical protein